MLFHKFCPQFLFKCPWISDSGGNNCCEKCTISRSLLALDVSPDRLCTSICFTQDDYSDHSLGTMTMSMSMSGTNLYEAARLSGGSSILENLQSQLKLREGEITQLQVAIQNKAT